MKCYSDEITARYHASGVWDDITWNDYITAHAEANPDAEAIVDQPDKAEIMGLEPLRLTWRQVRHRIDGLALGLLDAGVRTGDVVFVQLPNSTEYVFLHLALDRIGAIGTFAPMRQRASEVRYAINKTRARVAVCFGEFLGYDYLGMIDRLKPDCPTLDSVIVLGGGGRAEADFELSAMIQDADPRRLGELDALRPSADDVLTLCLTTGTESFPKVVPKTTNGWKVVTRALLAATGLDADSVFSGPFPYANMGGLGVELYPWIMAGGKFVVHEPFDVDVFLRQITDEKVNYIIAVPAIYFAMLNHPELDSTYDISSFTVVGCGGEAPPHTIIEALDARGISVINEFGATEGWVMFTLPDQELEERKDLFRLAEVRKLLPEDFKALEPGSEEEVSPGTPGELAVRGPSVFSGYLDADEVNARSFTSDGFFRTGDLVTIGDDETLRYVGRVKDMIIRSGQNISPAEIELIVQRHPSVYEVSVIGIPHPVRGQLVCACVSLKPGSAGLTLEDLQEFMRGREVARYKIPEQLEIVEELPKGPSGKILKRSLRDQFAASPSQAS
ncbi:AMP-binding protein [Sphaerisporangium sp. NPDC088356]|uniref:AMP-binding protein n=1 Tax=Sphaerisporangium sp. NPDC088356 TaxID=3154871 RepID=UPI00342DF2C1